MFKQESNIKSLIKYCIAKVMNIFVVRALLVNSPLKDIKNKKQKLNPKEAIKNIIVLIDIFKKKLFILFNIVYIIG